MLGLSAFADDFGVLPAIVRVVEFNRPLRLELVDGAMPGPAPVAMAQTMEIHRNRTM